MTPRPQLSLCIPVTMDTGLIQEFVENVSQFFQKFPLLYEVLFSVNPNQDQSLSLLQYLAERNPHYRIVENKSKLSRAQNICNLFSQARGDVLIATDLDLAAPLSEVFKMLEVFYSDKETEVVFGNRFKSKKNLETLIVEADKMESFFRDVLKDKTQWPFADPFCPLVAIRRTSFEKIKAALKPRGWHWTQELQRVALTHELKYQEIPLYMGSRKGTKPPKSEALHLLHFVLFRV
ncbi:MAG: glycosyltransferase [Bdellovibrionales bacterium]|nr:glycosyltransferase [Bdellovibrionales bacterium]